MPPSAFYRLAVIGTGGKPILKSIVVEIGGSWSLSVYVQKIASPFALIARLVVAAIVGAGAVVTASAGDQEQRGQNPQLGGDS
jgi:hypothetical protein